MGLPASFKGANMRFTAPKGEEERVGSLEAFSNGACVVTCWELDDAEIEEIIRTRKVFMSQFAQGALVAHYIGSEKEVRRVVVDFGGIW